MAALFEKKRTAHFYNIFGNGSHDFESSIKFVSILIRRSSMDTEELLFILKILQVNWYSLTLLYSTV